MKKFDAKLALSFHHQQLIHYLLFTNFLIFEIILVVKIF